MIFMLHEKPKILQMSCYLMLHFNKTTINLLLYVVKGARLGETQQNRLECTEPEKTQPKVVSKRSEPAENKSKTAKNGLDRAPCLS
ncbi:hypothetical protein Hanom_Chr06g00513561 [Helianthus anomalus]